VKLARIFLNIQPPCNTNTYYKFKFIDVCCYSTLYLSSSPLLEDFSRSGGGVCGADDELAIPVMTSHLPVLIPVSNVVVNDNSFNLLQSCSLTYEFIGMLFLLLQNIDLLY